MFKSYELEKRVCFLIKRIILEKKRKEREKKRILTLENLCHGGFVIYYYQNNKNAVRVIGLFQSYHNLSETLFPGP